MSEELISREGSTLGIMDDIQFAVHTYDGCPRGCSGCLVDKEFKNRQRFKPILSQEQMDVISDRVKEYAEWAIPYLNGKEGGYFGADGYKVEHYSYTMRFGNHSELPTEHLVDMCRRLDSEYRVFSTGPVPEEVAKFVDVRKEVPGRYFLEIIYDPNMDSPQLLRDMILEMRGHGILGYPEILLTRQIKNNWSPERFVAEHVVPIADLGVQMQFGRFSPSKTRGFSTTQMVSLDEEVEWQAGVAREIVRRNLDVHPIPLGEYAVTLLDEYGEMGAMRPDGSIDESMLPEPAPFDIRIVKEKTRDIFLTSLYIDHNLDLFVWSESMGQHVLDTNFGFKALGNVRHSSIRDIVMQKGGGIDKMLNQVVRELLTHNKCSGCRYKSFCASHAIPLFREWHDDDGKHCYGYLPVIREYQRSLPFLNNMIGGFAELGF